MEELKKDNSIALLVCLTKNYFSKNFDYILFGKTFSKKSQNLLFD
jgi:hypothetical protein